MDGEGTQIQVRADVCTKSGLCMQDPAFTRPWPRRGLRRRRGHRRSSLLPQLSLFSHHLRHRHLEKQINERKKKSIGEWDLSK